jgi:translocation and assembly module TamB
MSLFSRSPHSRREPDPEPRKSSPPAGRGRRWGRIIGWLIGGLICLTVVALAMLGMLVNSGGAHRAIINFAERRASASLGFGVRLENFALHWSTLSLDLYGITVDGAGPYPNPPLLRVDHLRMGVRVVSILRRKWHLSDLRVDHPVVWIYKDKNGVSNIPSFGSGRAGSGNNNELFDLGVRRAVLDRGEVYYNARPSTLAADLRDLELRATYNARAQMYSGRIAYAGGQLKYGAYRPIPHNLDFTFDLTPTTLRLNEAKLSIRNSQLLFSAVVNNYQKTPEAQAQYRATIDGHEAGQLLKSPAVPAGMIHISGSIHYQRQDSGPLIRAIAVKGDLTSDRLYVNASGTRVQVARLAAHYSLSNGNAVLRDLRASLLGGEVTAQGTMTNLGGDSRSNLSAALHNISLAELQQEAGKQTAAPGMTLAGTLNATATAAWGRTMDDLAAHADASIHGQVASAANSHPAPPATDENLLNVSQRAPAASAAVAAPIDSEIHATYTRVNGYLEVVNSYLRTAQTYLMLNGKVSSRSNLAFRLQANDLRELASIVNSFHPPAPNQQPLELSGAASMEGNVTGSMTAPHVTGQLTAMNLHANGTDWKRVRARIDASPDHAAVEDADLEPATQGRITLSGRAALNHWDFSRRCAIQAQLSASQIDLADLTRFTASPADVNGTLNANISLRGSAMNPQGSGDLLLTGVTVYQQPVRSVRVEFSGNGDQAQATMDAQTSAGSVHAKVTVQPKARTYSAQLTSPGIRLQRLAALRARDIQAKGMLRLSASGQGSFDNPALNAAIETPSLTVSGQSISSLRLQLTLANHVAHAALVSTALNAPVQAKATVQLTGDYPADATLDTPVVSIQPLLAVYAPDEAADISGQMQAHAAMHGPLKNPRAIEAQLTIPVLNVNYQNKVQMAASPIQVNYRDGIIDVPQGTIHGTDTNLRFQGHIPTSGDGAMSLQLEGAIDLKLFELFDPNAVSSGQIRLNIDSHGALAKGAALGGEIEIVNANIAEPDLPVGMQNGNGVLKLTTDHINITRFEATVGGGTVVLQGGMAYRPRMEFALGLAAKGVRVLYPQGMRQNVDARLRLDGTTERAVLGGTVDVTNLSFTPAFDLPRFVGQFSGGVMTPPSQGFADNVALNVALHSTNNMNLVSREVSLSGSANLQVRGTAAEPVILGRVNLTDGDIILNGNRFVLNSGTIQFVNPSQTEPVLNLSMSTTVQEYNIDVRFEGPVEQMRASYSSNPALPQADIIHLLAFGSTTEAAINNPTPANQQAESLVASQVSSQITSRISRAAGISQLSISPVLQGGTAQGPPGAQITIRQRVTGNLFVTFSTNVATTQDQVIQGQYQVSPRVSVSATRDQNGGFAVDTLFKHSW